MHTERQLEIIEAIVGALEHRSEVSTLFENADTAEGAGTRLQGQLGGRATRCLARKRHCASATRSKVSVPG